MRGGAGAGPDCSAPEPRAQRGELPGRAQAFWARQPAPAGPVPAHLPAGSGLCLGQLTLRGGEGWCSPSPLGPQTSEGSGGTFLAFYKKPAAQGQPWAERDRL